MQRALSRERLERHQANLDIKPAERLEYSKHEVMPYEERILRLGEGEERWCSAPAPENRRPAEKFDVAIGEHPYE